MNLRIGFQDRFTWSSMWSARHRLGETVRTKHFSAMPAMALAFGAGRVKAVLAAVALVHVVLVLPANLKENKLKMLVFFNTISAA